MDDDFLQQKRGVLRRMNEQLVLLEQDGLPWILDGRLPPPHCIGTHVTLSGYAYSECRFEVVALVDEPRRPPDTTRSRRPGGSPARRAP